MSLRLPSLLLQPPLEEDRERYGDDFEGEEVDDEEEEAKEEEETEPLPSSCLGVFPSCLPEYPNWALIETGRLVYFLV